MKEFVQFGIYHFTADEEINNWLLWDRSKIDLYFRNDNPAKGLLGPEVAAHAGYHYPFVYEFIEDIMNEGSDIANKFRWTVMEKLQEKLPYYKFGWEGIIPIILFEV